MNKKITLLLLFTLIVTIGNSQDYYWSNNGKIPIFKNDTKVLVKVTEGSPAELSITRETSMILGIKRINENSILIELKKDIDKDNLFRFTENMISSFKNQSGDDMVPTGEVLFKPKKGYNFNDINRITKGSLELVQEKYGCFTATLKNYRDLITVSNNIYESGLVEYSHPNFIAEIIRDQNDPLYPDQYYLNNTGQFGGTAGIDINAPQAWAITTGLTDIRVAVIDDGVENHLDINGRVVQGYTPTNSTGFGAPAFNSVAHGQA